MKVVENIRKEKREKKEKVNISYIINLLLLNQNQTYIKWYVSSFFCFLFFAHKNASCKRKVVEVLNASSKSKQMRYLLEKGKGKKPMSWK